MAETEKIPTKLNIDDYSFFGEKGKKAFSRNSVIEVSDISCQSFFPSSPAALLFTFQKNSLTHQSNFFFKKAIFEKYKKERDQKRKDELIDFS